MRLGWRPPGCCSVSVASTRATPYIWPFLVSARLPVSVLGPWRPLPARQMKTASPGLKTTSRRPLARSALRIRSRAF
eukprot:13329526-Alexandrium_andersonii.AAC.1